MMRSEVIVDNVGFESFLPKRSEQLLINTWHGGGAYKKVSADMKMHSEGVKWYIRRVRELSEGTTDFFLSSSRTFTDITSDDFFMDRNCFIPTGMPRNDRFFLPTPGKTWLSDSEYADNTMSLQTVYWCFMLRLSEIMAQICGISVVMRVVRV